MNHPELLKELSEAGGITAIEANLVLTRLRLIVLREVAEGREFKFLKLGKFLLKMRKARPGRNLRTRQLVQVPERRALVFKASEKIKEELNNSQVLGE